MFAVNSYSEARRLARRELKRRRNGWKSDRSGVRNPNLVPKRQTRIMYAAENSNNR